LVERNHYRCGNLFIKFIYCSVTPLVNECELVHFERI